MQQMEGVVIRLFCGVDAREQVGFHVFLQSVLEHTKEPVSITPLAGRTDGSNAFTLARFLVPMLCRFEGRAIWCDGSDQMLRADLAELWFTDFRGACAVVKHAYKTKHPRKYVGTPMEADNQDYERKNWSSVVLWNCSHYANRALTKSFVEAQSGRYLHRFAWLDDGLDHIAELPPTWNWMPDEFGPNPDAKLLHWTAGAPMFAHYSNAPHAEEWRKTLRNAQRGLW